MRPCTPTQDVPAPRESAFKSIPHPAAPVGKSSQTRRHHLTPTPYSNFARTCKVAAKAPFFSYTGRGTFSFWARPKREWGAHLPSHQHG